jgi:tRNA dimethylallyltransferase
MTRPFLLVLTGPTASGKTAVALRLARHLHGEIVSADSRQVYRRMNIGTAKPTPEERRQVPHHMIDVVDPDEPYNAGIYAQQAREVVAAIVRRGRTPLVVGGSGLYLRALVDGFFEEVTIDPTIRETLRRELAERGIDDLHAELVRIDPATAARVHRRDVPRILRAIEVFRATGEPISVFQTGDHRGLARDYRILQVGLAWPREELYERINIRVDAMIQRGLVDEVRALMTGRYRSAVKALQTVGYREIIDYLEGRCSLDEAVGLIKRNSRRYAKRQLTWLRHDSRIRWVDARAPDVAEIILQQITDNLYREEIADATVQQNTILHRTG